MPLILMAATSMGIVLMSCSSDDDPEISDVNLIYGVWENIDKHDSGVVDYTKNRWGFSFYREGREVNDGKILMWSVYEGDVTDRLWGFFLFSEGKIVIHKNYDMSDASLDKYSYEVIKLNERELIIREHIESFGQSSHRDMVFSKFEGFYEMVE